MRCLVLQKMMQDGIQNNDMKLPNKVRIGGMNYSLSQRQTSEDLGKMLEIEGIVFGCYSHKEQEIHIAKDLKEEQSQLTTIHEIIHGIFRHYLPQMDAEQEEDLVNLISNGLFQVICDNKQLASTVFGGPIEAKKKKVMVKNELEPSETEGVRVQ